MINYTCGGRCIKRRVKTVDVDTHDVDNDVFSKHANGRLHVWRWMHQEACHDASRLMKRTTYHCNMDHQNDGFNTVDKHVSSFNPDS